MPLVSQWVGLVHLVMHSAKIADPTIRALYKRQQKKLLRLIHPDSEYSAASLAYTKEQIYKLEQGHQIKREWLEETLES